MKGRSASKYAKCLK